MGLNISRDDFTPDGDKFILDYNKLTTALEQLKTKYSKQFENSSTELENYWNDLGK
mgnify:CR=1 FL=1